MQKSDNKPFVGRQEDLLVEFINPMSNHQFWIVKVTPSALASVVAFRRSYWDH